jgi:hypothetical protein
LYQGNHVDEVDYGNLYFSSFDEGLRSLSLPCPYFKNPGEGHLPQTPPGTAKGDISICRKKVTFLFA